jgi:predicted RND superfamily exporter protein
MMNKTFFARFALPILMLVFFTVPFALRGARMAFTTMKNDVKDWLPADFDETKDLDWFRDNFLGEQFVLLTWPGCSADDNRFKLLVEKLEDQLHVDAGAPAPGDVAPKADGDDVAAADAPTEDAAPAEEVDPESASAMAAVQGAKTARDREREKTRQLGDRLGLSTTGDFREDWGGLNEKWLLGNKDEWYYITPEGGLFKWDGGNNLLGWASRKLEKSFTGKNTASGTLVATVGEKPTPDAPNEYHADPRKMNARFFKTVTTGPQVLERLAGPNGGLQPRGDYSDEERSEIAHKLAMERLSGALFGPDGKQTCLIVTLSEVGRRDLKRVLGRPMLGKPPGRLLQLTKEAGLDYEDLRLGGPPVDNVAIDEEGSITLVRLIGWSVLLGVGLAYVSFRSIKITFMLFFVGGISAIFSLSFVWYAHDFVDAIVMSMPSLVYVLGLTCSVHMLTYYRHHVVEHGLEGAAEATIKHTWKPLLLAQFTSALGLLSLLTSNLLPIRKFGFYSALGTLATLAILYLYLPAALQLWPPGYEKRRTGETTGFEKWVHEFGERFWARWATLVVNNHYWIAPGVGVVVIMVAFGATKLKTNVHLLKMFDSDSKIIQDYAWLENNLGRLVPMELVVRMRPTIAAPLMSAVNEDTDAKEKPTLEQQIVRLNFLERMEITDFVQKAIETEFGPSGQNVLGQGMSAVTFAPPIPERGTGIRSPRGVVNRKLEQHRDEFLTSDYLRIDKDPQHVGSELWRVSLRLGALNDVDYGEFVNDLKSVVEPVMTAVRHRETVLTELVKARGEQGLNGAKIAVVGIGGPKSYEKAAKEDQPATGAAIKVKSDHKSKQLAYAREQERLFAQTFAGLLENRGMKTTAKAKNKLEFLDATTLVDADGKPLAKDAIADRLKAYDCVVFAQPMDQLALADVQKLNPLVIDASDFRFDPFGKAPASAKRDDNVQTIYTGVVPVVYKAQRTLLDSLLTSTYWAFISIALCLMVLLRRGPLRPWNFLNFRAGLVAMLPNMFPLLIVFGAIGWLGIEVDIGSMMTASIAIGVAVDDTIHYLEFFRKEMLSGKSRREAIIVSYQHCGSAIIETMLIGGFGLSVFAFSTFTPTQRFGTMMLCMLAVGAAGELIWMPALLAGPLGKYFEPIGPKPTEPQLATPEGRMHLEAPHAGRSGALRKDAAH